MKIVIGNDHVALEMKLQIKEYLEQKGIEVIDVGTDSPERCDYPVYGEKAAKMVVSGEADCGILICGTGIGISLSANKVNGIRACVCSEPYSARLSKQHNNTKMIVDEWLNASFEGGRHQRRIDMLNEIEKRN